MSSYNITYIFVHTFTKSTIIVHFTKHINVRFNNVREKVLSGSVVLEYINTKDQLADIFTKCLGKNEFVKLRDLILG